MTFRSMADAPRNGTPVEIECSYGRRPWYDLMLWRDGRWWSINRPGHCLSSEKHARWRPHEGSASEYVDPTGGLQFRGEYWSGLPGDMRGNGAMLAPGESMTVETSIETDPAKLEEKMAKELGEDAIRLAQKIERELGPEPPPPSPSDEDVSGPRTETSSDWIPPAALILFAIILAVIGGLLL